MPKTKTLLLLTLAALSIHAADAQRTGQEVGQTPEWHYLVDPTNEMAAEEALARRGEFTLLPAGQVKPKSSETYWLYLKENPFSQDAERYLIFGDYDQIWLYYIVGNEIRHIQVNGRLIHPDKRVAPGPPYGFPVVQDGEEILVKVKNHFLEDHRPVSPRLLGREAFLALQSEQQFIRKNNILFAGILLGILIPFFLNGLILFFLRGKMYYLYWALYVLFNLFFGLLSFEKYAHLDVLFSFEPYITINLERGVNIVMVVFYLLFLLAFLDLPDKYRWLLTVIRYFLYYEMLAGILDMISVLLFKHSNFILSFIDLAIFPTVVFYVSMVIVIPRVKRIETNLVLAGVSFFFIGTAFSILELKQISVFPNSTFFENYVAPAFIGTVLEAICFALAIAFKDNKSEKQKIEAEARLKNVQKLEEAKSRLYQNITHEFRTPLTNILGIAGLIEKNPGKNLKTGLQKIRNNSHNLLDLVNQMLGLARMDTGEAKLDLRKYELITTLKYIVEAFQFRAKAKRICLELVSGTEELQMDFDHRRVQQILSNLLDNAIKHTPRDGRIWCYIHALDHPFVKIEVRDTGTGIAKEELPFIFDRFYQASPSLPKGGQRSSSPLGGGGEGAGTGLGLSIVKEWVKLMDGRISVESEEGKGTSFFVELPIVNHADTPLHSENGWEAAFTSTDSTEAEPSTSTLPAHPQDAPTILIVEDNADVIYFLDALFSDTYRILSAPDGQAGLEMAQEHIPDIILSDIMMPALDGLAMCRALKQDVKTSHIPIILITAKATPEEKNRGLAAGASAYLVKPFSEEELGIRITNLLETRRQMVAYLKSRGLVPEFWQGKVDQDIVFYGQLAKQIEDNLKSSNLDIHFLCRAFHMSRTQLCRKVKAVSGLPVGQLIRQIRLRKAKYLLETTADNVQQICLEVGLKDASYFAQAFQKEFGRKPSDIRRPDVEIL
ncbi:MAG: response regulator [Lewinellaceae bacterium]|nr:response regulator [Phaeodactylibacter sp.]MCB9041583.1 response regulator [Lewinellaceae bacterium]